VSRARSAALALGALVLAPGSAQAFELLRTVGGVPLSWPVRALAYGVDFRLDDPAEVAFSAAARSAFDRWGTASLGALRPRYRGPERTAPADGLCTLARLASWPVAFGDAERTIAFTELFYDRATGVLREGDVHLNGERFAFEAPAEGRGPTASAFDAESVLVHELGHLLGLAHTCGEPGSAYPSCFSIPDEPPGRRSAVLEAVMAPTLAPGSARRTLTADDRAGLAVHFGGTATAAPGLLVLERRCPAGALAVEVERRPLSPQVSWRPAEGGELPAAASQLPGGALALPEPPIPGADLVLVDPRSGAYAALIAPELPAACSPADDVPDPAPGDGPGCGCVSAGRSGPRESRQTPWAALTLLGTLAASCTSRLRRIAARSRPRALVLSFALGAWPARDAEAFKCSRVRPESGPSLFWPSRQVSWLADDSVRAALPDGDAALAEVQQSFEAWTAVDCSDLEFPFGGVRPDLRAEFQKDGENHNVVVFTTTGWPYDRGAIALTTSAFDTRTGLVVDADVEINGERFEFQRVEEDCQPRSGVMDLRNALTHEVGHVLGLEHPPNTPRYAETTMFASAPPCETRKRTLAQDDVDGICSIYPVGAPTAQCFPPDGESFEVVDSDDGFGGCRDARPPRSAGDAPWALALGALLLARRPGRGR
jgi:hypothetical protein